MKTLMKTRNALFILLTIFALQSCNKPSSDSGGKKVSETNEELKTVVTGYLKIKNALVKDNSALAKEEAASLTASTGQYQSELNEYLEAIADTDDIETQREAFEALSESVYKIAKEGDAGLTVYRQYCPMAFDDKGAFWLSDSKEVYNPYFGASMLRCGSVEEVIN